MARSSFIDPINSKTRRALTPGRLVIVVYLRKNIHYLDSSNAMSEKYKTVPSTGWLPCRKVMKLNPVI